MTALAMNMDWGRRNCVAWLRLPLMLLAVLALIAFTSHVTSKSWAQTTPPTTEAPKTEPPKPDAKPTQETKPEAKPEEKKEEPKGPKAELNTGDTAWMLTSTALVLLMTIPGVAFFYGGMVRKKNVLSTMAQSFSVTALITVL